MEISTPGRERRPGGRSRRFGDGARAGEQAGDIGSGEMADPESAARILCLDWLSTRPHTRAELAKKLRVKGVPEEAALAVLDRYDEVGLVDDAAFSTAWVESRHAGRGLARRALAQELRTRGVDDDTIATAVSQVSLEDEVARAQQLVARKLAGMSRVPPEARARRLIGMLARKGYGGSLAARVVREALAGSGLDIPDPDHDHR